MKSNLLLVISLLFLVFNLKAQDPTKNEEHSDLENDLGPHIHLHERGYYFVTQEFMNPYNDRSSKPVLDSAKFTYINDIGDTFAVVTNLYTISEENRLTKLEVKQYLPGMTENIPVRETTYFYETVASEMIQRDTTYAYNDIGILEFISNRVLTINSNGIITSITQQQYMDGDWVNFNLTIWDFNEFGCLNSRKNFDWSGTEYYSTFSWINECEDELITNELYFRHDDLGTIEIPLRSTEYIYDEFKRLTHENVYRPDMLDPENFNLDFVRLYSYNEANLNDSIYINYWIEEFEQFYLFSVIHIIYDEIGNIIDYRNYRFDELNNLYLSYNQEYIFDNNFLNGDFLSGSANSNYKSMLLQSTISNEGNITNDFQYFYSTGSVSSTEQPNHIYFKVYPNPTSGELNIKFSDLVVTYPNVIVRNSTGAIVMNQIADGVNNLNVGHLPSGMYFISVEGSNLRSEVKKFIKL